MLNIPQRIRELLHQDSVSKNIRITFPEGQRADICNDLIVRDSVRLTESLSSQDDLKFGLCESPIFECQTVGVENIRGFSIQVYCEVYCEPTDEGAVFRPDLNAFVYPIPYGMFTVTSCKRRSDMLHRDIIAYNAINGAWYPPEVFNVLANYTSPVNKPLQFTSDALAYMMFPDALGKELQAKNETDVYDSTKRVGFAQRFAHGVSYKYRYIAIDYVIVDKSIGYGTNGFAYGLNAYKIKYDKNDILKGIDFINEYLESISASKITLDLIRRTINPLAIEGYYEPKIDEPSISAYISPYMKQNTNNYVVGRNAGVNQKLIIDDKWHVCMGIEYDVSISDYYNLSSFRRDDVTFDVQNYDAIDYLLMHSGRSSRATIFLPVGISVYSSEPSKYNIGTPIVTYKFQGARCEVGSYSWTDEKIAAGVVDLALKVQSDGITQIQTETWEKNSFSRKSTGTRNDYTYVNGISELSKYDLRNVISAGYELKGLIGRFDRYGDLNLIDLTKKFTLTPSQKLYPSEDLKPSSATGGRVLPNQTHSILYDDEYQEPFGRVCCTFKNMNNEEQWEYYDLVDDYSEDTDKYLEYSLTDNAIIKDRNWNPETIRGYLEVIANKLKTVQYMSCTAVINGYPEVEIGDTLELYSILNDSIVALVMKRELEGEMVITDTITSV